jgi:hypothetical protein
VGSKQKLLLRVGLHGKILFLGAHSNLGPPGSTPPKGGICFENWAGASKQKLLLGVGLNGKKIFFRAHLNPGLQGPPIPNGVFAFELSS